jgi:hypothetical protein
VDYIPGRDERHFILHSIQITADYIPGRDERHFILHSIQITADYIPAGTRDTSYSIASK